MLHLNEGPPRKILTNPLSPAGSLHPYVWMRFPPVRKMELAKS